MKKLASLIFLSLCISTGISFEEVNDSSMTINFCPSQNCEDTFIEFIKSTKFEIYCALYELHEDYLKVFDEMVEVDRLIIMERQNIKEKREFIIPDTNRALMHHKFCIVDNKKVWFGTANPTKNGFLRNDNVYFIIENEFVEEFKIEFNRLLGKEKKANVNSEKIIFCRQQDCGILLQNEIKNANKTIFFATFSFTDKFIATQLIIARNRGVEVNGVFEERMVNGLGSIYPLLKYQLQENISIDTNQYTMHQKLFIIDDTVWVGSYNPTNNGRHNNDEFVYIIRDKEISKIFKEYYYKLKA